MFKIFKISIRKVRLPHADYCIWSGKTSDDRTVEDLIPESEHKTPMSVASTKSEVGRLDLELQLE